MSLILCGTLLFVYGEGKGLHDCWCMLALYTRSTGFIDSMACIIPEDING